MAIKHGRRARGYVGGVDLSGFLKDVGTASDRDMADSSSFGDDDRTFVSGQRGGTLSLGGMFSARVDDLDPQEIADTLDAAFEDAEGAVIACQLPQGDTNGNVAKCIEGHISSNPVSSPNGDIVSINGELTSDVGVERCVVLHAKGEETSDDNGNGLDQTASSVEGAAGYLQVFDVGGSGTLTVKIQHSADNSTFADLITFTAQTAGEVAERKAIAEGVTINRYVRALWTLDSGDAVFFVCFSRKTAD